MSIRVVYKERGYVTLPRGMGGDGREGEGGGISLFVDRTVDNCLGVVIE